jgi:glycerol-3-phosphate O-acyltransferase
MMEDEGLTKEICELSVEKGSSAGDVTALARRYAEEIAADVNYTYLENASRIMRWVIKNIYDGIDINAEGIASLKRAAASAPVILVPNHRSHMDYLILSTVLYENNVTIPHVAAGMNLSFWPMGRIFRKCGAFFTRRKFAGNKLYRSAFKAYLKLLLKEGYCQEFFIEGGRSRTGKLLRPRTGMLTMLAEGLREGAARQAFFIPVSIAYDHVIEQYKKELSGEAKRGERTRDLLRLPRILTKKYGKIYVRFGEPIPYNGGEGDIRASVLQTAASIAASVNRGLTVTPASVAASALLAASSRGITAGDFEANSAEIIKYLKWKGAAFSKALEDGEFLAMHGAVGRFLKAHNVILHKGFQPACYEVKEDERGVIDYYKNNIVHFFVSASCTASIILAYMRKGVFKPPPEDIKERFLFCKDIFAFEFAFSTRLSVDEHIGRVMEYFEREGILSNTKRLELFKAFCQNYFEAYLVALNACLSLRRMGESVFLKTLAKYARHLHLLGRVTRVEGISAPIFKNALQIYTNLGILSVETDRKGRNIYTCGEKTELAEKVKLKLEELC